MNKTLIRQYKAEFDHWLDGGKLQAKFVYDQWEEAPKDVFSYSTVNFILVINDEYVEFRKALAEGKTIQYYVDSFVGWQDVKSLNQPCKDPNSFRIKPDVPKFKVGDWVKRIKTGHITQVSRIGCEMDDAINVDGKTDGFLEEQASTKFTLWQPKPDEWCIVYDLKKDPYPKTIKVRKWDNKCKWKPLPFTGKLPPYVIDKNKKN